MREALWAVGFVICTIGLAVLWFKAGRVCGERRVCDHLGIAAVDWAERGKITVKPQPSERLPIRTAPSKMLIEATMTDFERRPYTEVGRFEGRAFDWGRMVYGKDGAHIQSCLARVWVPEGSSCHHVVPEDHLVCWSEVS